MHTFYMPKRIRPDIFFIVKKKHKLGVDHSPKKVTLWGTFKPSNKRKNFIMFWVPCIKPTNYTPRRTWMDSNHRLTKYIKPFQPDCKLGISYLIDGFTPPFALSEQNYYIFYINSQYTSQTFNLLCNQDSIK